ncbi:MAG: site-specific DNA-methyltransferase [Candidatus Dormibacteria bacterium]
MPRRAAGGGSGGSPNHVPVEAVVHRKAKRTNIPTSELGGFVAEAERAPQTVLYPRDPSLDPQLVWKGKDEQDRYPLEVPAVPVYIQEKVAPRAIIENLRAETRRGQAQADLFSDFNGIAFEDLVNFYQHKQNWSNRMILGDSLLVMTSLAEKEGLKRQVQCVYMDPPYGIKFGSNWQVSTRKRDVRDGRAEDATRQPEQVKAFRDTWELGIHSYLSYLRDRLIAARELLTDSGSIFIQIGDQNVHIVRSVLDEVFGSDNACAQVTFKKTSGATSELLPAVMDYVLWYAKDREQVRYRQLYRAKAADDSQYNWVYDPERGPRPARAGDDELPRLRHSPLTSQRPPGDFPVTLGGRIYTPRTGYWKTNPEGMARLIAAGRVVALGNTLEYVRYVDDFPATPWTNLWDDTVTSGFADPKVFVVQTNPRAIERCVLMTTDPGDLVLDPTCGSGTTAYVAEEWGRRWITIDTSRVALTLTRARLMSARYPQYVLTDSAEGARLLAERAGQVPRSSLPRAEGDVSRGFVYRTVPHVTLKSIANNPDIREGMSRDEIDAAIARHAEREYLHDQPLEDRRVVRVAGPFTVESLSPHRIVDADDGSSNGDATAGALTNDGKFADTILENLRASGVQNTVKNERLIFRALDPWPGDHIQAVGEYDEAGITRRAAVCIGPEHGTVGPELVREAAKEAARHFDLLVVCGFAFDARVGEEARQMGRLTVLKAAINPDLQFGGDILKKTGNANLFTVFGEPDIELREEDGSLVVAIHGVDVYDPTTGEVRSNSTDDIACWFIDTDYNEESFFVRHAYFTGGNDPYAQLKRALRAEVDEEAWGSLYRTVSRPFPPPATRRIAVKVINHYGDEVMKVYDSAAAVAVARPYVAAQPIELVAADEADRP